MTATKEPEKTQETKWKIPPVKVLSDDCAIYVDRVIEDGEITEQGTPHKVHEGEWIEVLQVRTLGEIAALTEMSGSEGISLRSVCTEVAKRVVAWNWTGLDSEPLAQPYRNPDVLMDLTDDELAWVIGAAKGQETSADRKKG